MSNSLTDQYIEDTFSGILHVSGQELPSTGRVSIYDGNGNKTPIKIGRDGNGIELGSLEYPTSNDGTSIGSIIVQSEPNKLALKNQNTLYGEVLNFIFPVGSVFFSSDSVNPQTRFTGTTWEQISQGRFLVGVGTGTDVNSISKTIQSGNIVGEYEKNITSPPHKHGAGKFQTNDDHLFILQDWDDGNTYTMGRVTGEDPYIQVGSQTGSPRGTVTSLNIDNSEITVNNTPPGFGLFVWRRLT